MNDQGSEFDELDLLAPQARPARMDQDGPSSLPPPDTESQAGPPALDLTSESELKNLIAANNPGLFRDLHQIEKGVDNFFLFHESPLALCAASKLASTTAQDLEWLKENNAIVSHRFLNMKDGVLHAEEVLIRPASLKHAKVNRVIHGCDHFSALAVMRLIARDDQIKLHKEREGALGTSVSARFLGSEAGQADVPDVHQLITGLRRLSLEMMLDHLDPDGTVTDSVISTLSKPSSDIVKEYGETVLPDVMAALTARLDQPFLLSLSMDFHVASPKATDLLEMEHGQIKTLRTEVEWVHQLFTQIARKILVKLLPPEQSGWVSEKESGRAERYLVELKKHPSFAAKWQDGGMFLDAFEVLIKKAALLQEYRRAILSDLLAKDTVRRLNMRFEPLYLRMEDLAIPPKAAELYGDVGDLREALFEKIKSYPDVLHFQERRHESGGSGGMYVLYRTNLAQTFIEDKKIRTFLHQMARYNGTERGIYGFVRDVKEAGDPGAEVDKQTRLIKAIKEWEEQLEKDRRKGQRSFSSLVNRLVGFFLGLFGRKKTRREGDSPRKRTGEPQSRAMNPTRLLIGPKEKRVRILPAVQHAVEIVQERFDGIIWLDEVLRELDSVRYTEDSVGDMLFYDQEERFVEVRPMIKIRRVFLRKEKEANREWRRFAIERLEVANSALPPSQRGPIEELITHLRSLD